MKKLLLTVLGLVCATSLTVLAQDAKPAKEGKAHVKMTDEQKALYKSMVEKYDTNKDGKLDKEEKAKMSKEDKDKMKEAGLNHGKKDKK